MLKLLLYLTRKRSFLLFVLLELIAFVLIIDAHSYSKIKQHSFNTAVSGFVNNRLDVINYHFNLAKTNQSLVEQNARLLKGIANNKKEKSGVLPYQFDVLPCFIISNQYQFKNNSIIINKGEIDGVMPEMGIIGTNGIIGITQKTSSHFAQVISVLNTYLKVSVSIKNTNYTGFMQWNGNNPNIFDVVDVPINANVKQGDTLVTSGVSNIFPKGIPVGKIINFEELTDRKSYKIVLQPFMDMTNLGAAYIIKNKYKQEFDSINKAK
jgi:rod shape-determining protein MreC